MKEYKTPKKIKDPSDLATVNKVFDKDSTKIIESLKKRGKLFNFSDPISTGKEAVVFTGEISGDLESKFIQNKDMKEINKCIIKIYKVNTMFFRDRNKYIQNEIRFSNFCTSNNRKLIKVWAEKEVRNLNRLNKNDINSPKPFYLKNNVFIMEMIDENGTVAPTLKKYKNLTEKFYDKAIKLISDIFNKAKLVHADLSEYNILVKNEELYVIDVGQSVDLSHENALYFLITDICNMNRFFSKKGFQVKNENEIFENVTGLKIPSYLKDIKLNKNSFIPTSLAEIANEEDASLFLDIEESVRDLSAGSNATSDENIFSNDLAMEDESAMSEPSAKSDGLQGKLDLNILHKNVIKKQQKKITKEQNRERRREKSRNK